VRPSNPWNIAYPPIGCLGLAKSSGVELRPWHSEPYYLEAIEIQRQPAANSTGNKKQIDNIVSFRSLLSEWEATWTGDYIGICPTACNRERPETPLNPSTLEIVMAFHVRAASGMRSTFPPFPFELPGHPGRLDCSRCARVSINYSLSAQGVPRSGEIEDYYRILLACREYGRIRIEVGWSWCKLSTPLLLPCSVTRATVKLISLSPDRRRTINRFYPLGLSFTPVGRK